MLARHPAHAHPAAPRGSPDPSAAPFGRAQVKEMGGETRRKLLSNLTDEQHLDIDLFLAHFPDIEITFDAHVEDEDDVQALPYAPLRVVMVL